MLQVLEKSFFITFRLICADKIFKMVRGIFFKINESVDILNFEYFALNFTCLKTVLHNKVINKKRTKNDQEYSAHRFGANY